jgi:uncharacterized membrane protein
MDFFDVVGVKFLLRWIHFMAGITWIGLLYYFNFVQTPFFGTELGGQARGAMVRGLVPNALWWFRWGAMVTFLSGWTTVLVWIWEAGWSLSPNAAWLTLIVTGGAMGTVMWANVWFVIWPAQRIAIASAERVAAGDPQAAARAPRAARASRTNTLFSIPLLFFMGSATHFAGPLLSVDRSYILYFVLLLIVVALIEVNALAKDLPTQKPLSTVPGTILSGFGLTVVLYVIAKIAL